jgi:uncharacterized cupin superfamily protein
VPVPEATIKTTDAGAEVASDGWFVLNLADARWMRNERAGAACVFERRDAPFDGFGINVRVLQPGEPNGKYHLESVQEGFLVLSGECLLLIEDQERRLRAWDFVHCPPGTAHIVVGAGDGPCAILMVGARRPDSTIHYPRTDLAARHGAAAPHDTDVPREAYADWSRELTALRMPWPIQPTPGD